MAIVNKNEIWEFLKLVIVALVIIIPFRLYIAQPFIVRGSSMDPSFYDGEYLIIDEVSYYFENPSRGDVIVFHYPGDTSKFFIKRIIGLPGETIQINDGKVTIFNNEHPEGFLLEEKYIDDETVPDTYKNLSDNEYFVMGDNRPFSSDSRHWGTLNKNLIVGRAWLRLFPPQRFDLWPGVYNYI